jgi:hypothetical protein
MDPSGMWGNVLGESAGVRGGSSMRDREEKGFEEARGRVRWLWFVGEV